MAIIRVLQALHNAVTHTMLTKNFPLTAYNILSIIYVPHMNLSNAP